MNRRNEEFAILWDFISSDKDLTYAEKILYSIILSLSTTEGYCWATNLQLMERMGISPGSQRTFQDFLTGLKEKNWIIVEGGTRDRKIYPLKKRIIAENQLQSNTVKKDIIAEKPHNIIAENQPESPTPPNKDRINTKVKVKHIEAWGKPTPSENSPYKKLEPMMKGPPPTPGPEKMVEETKKVLKSAIQIGSQKYLISEEDWPYFYGFSPRIVINAADKLNLQSRSGTMIRNPVAWLFTTCTKLKKG
jgi:hypothetical protein